MAGTNQQTLTGWNRTPQSATFNALSVLRFQQSSPGAGVANSTVTAQMVIPCLFKIRKVAAGYTATDDLAGGNAFNIVVGTGSYDTAGIEASQTVTAAGTWAQNDTATVVINGHTVTATITQASPTLTNVGADVVAAILADTTSNLLVTASNAAGVVTIRALLPGTAGNAITLTASKVSTSGTFVAGGATLAGGAGQSGVTIPPNDNSYSSGTAAPQSGTTDGAGNTNTSSGIGYPTDVAGAGMAVFSSDIGLTAAGTYPAGCYQAATGQVMTYAPGWIAASTTTGGYGVFVPPNYDAVYPMLLPITLRLQTAASTGSITAFTVKMLIETVTPLAEPGSLTYPVPGVNF